MVLNLELCIQALETKATVGSQQAGGGIHSGFGVGFGLAGGASLGGSAPAVLLSGGGANAVSEISSQFGILTAKVKELDAQLGNVTVSCGGQLFWSIKDCKVSIMQHVLGNTMPTFTTWCHSCSVAGVKITFLVFFMWDTTYHMKKAGFTCKAG
jgi:hypothetical protein